MNNKSTVETGRVGGKTLLKKRGKKYFSEIGKKGNAVKNSKKKV